MTIRISLTDFLDFVVASGIPKQTKVRQIKSRGVYHPNFDFYKQFRDAIVAYHTEGKNDKKYFDAFLSTVIDAKKTERYRRLVANYKKMLGKKKCVIQPNERTVWTYKNLEVSINPELCLDIDGEKHLIKLYFKAEKLSRIKIKVILYLMKNALPHIAGIDQYAIFDIFNNKIIKDASPDDLRPLLEAEAEHFLTLYKGV
jgi:hypothetical protein